MPSVPLWYLARFILFYQDFNLFLEILANREIFFNSKITSPSHQMNDLPTEHALNATETSRSSNEPKESDGEPLLPADSK